jgi:hypothetical protein
VFRWHRALTIALVAASSMAASSITLADEPAPLKSLVPAATYLEAGLDKLTAAEQAALARWLSGEGAAAAPTAPAPVAQAPTAPAPAAPADAPATPAAGSRLSMAAFTNLFTGNGTEDGTDVETRILPPFTGWSGKTVFRLENGQVWQQRMDGRYEYRGDDLRVLVGRGALGGYRIKLVANGRWIGVKRIR